MTQIKLRRDTAANFTSKNPVLGIGEPAYETDTKKLKIGDGTTAYTQLEYFSAGGGGSTDISATLPLKIVDGVISLEVDGQTIQIVDGKLHANLDDKQDKFETQAPLVITNASISTSTVPSITETAESWTGGGSNKLMTVSIQNLNIDANSDWKIHLSGYMGNYSSYSTNSTVVDLYTEDQQIFRIWFGSAFFRLGNKTTEFSQIPAQNSEFYYEIVHQKNDTKFTFNGTGLGSSDPLLISTMSHALGQAPYTTLAGKGKLGTLFFVIDSHLFRRIDKDISKSYIEADGVRYPITSVEGINTLKLGVGDGLSVVDGKLTASSTAPANMVTTDTAQDISGMKKFTQGSKSFIINEVAGIVGIASVGGSLNDSKSLRLSNANPSTWAVGVQRKDGYIYGTSLTRNDGNSNNVILDAGNLGSYVDGTTITYTNNKLSAASSGGGLEVKRATTANFNSAELLETGLYRISGSFSPQNGPVPYAVSAMLITMKNYRASNNQLIQQTWIGCEDLVANQIYTRYSQSNGVMTSWVRVDSNKIASASTLGSIKVGDGLTISSDGTLSASGGSAPTNMVTTDNFITFCQNNADAIKAALGL